MARIRRKNNAGKQLKRNHYLAAAKELNPNWRESACNYGEPKQQSIKVAPQI